MVTGSCIAQRPTRWSSTTPCGTSTMASRRTAPLARSSPTISLAAVSPGGHHLGWGNTVIWCGVDRYTTTSLGGGGKIQWGGTVYIPRCRRLFPPQAKERDRSTRIPAFVGEPVDCARLACGQRQLCGRQRRPTPRFRALRVDLPGCGGIARDITGGTVRPTAGSQWDIGADEQGGSLSSPTPPIRGPDFTFKRANHSVDQRAPFLTRDCAEGRKH